MQTYDLIFGKGVEQFEKNNFVEAIECFTKCIQLNPTNGEAYSNRGLSNYMLYRYSESINDFDKAIDINPINPMFYFNRGLAKKESLLFDQALKDFEIAKTMMPDNQDIFKEIQSLQKKERGEEISSSFLSKMTHDAEDPEIAFNQGELFMNNKKFKAAINCFSNAIEYKNNFAKAFLQRAKCYKELKYYKEAILDFQKAANCDYYFTSYAKDQIAQIYIELADFDLALRNISEAIDINPQNSIFYLHRGIVKLKLKDQFGAIDDLTQYINIDQTNGRVFSLRGKIYEALKNYEKSMIDYAKALSLGYTQAEESIRNLTQKLQNK